MVDVEQMAAQMEVANETLARMSVSIEKLTRGMLETLPEGAKKAAEKAGDEWVKAMGPDMQKKLAQQGVEATMSQWKKFFSYFKNEWDDTKRSWDSGWRSSAASVAKAGDKVTGLSSGLNKLKNSALAELPFGGLLGLMMYGKMKEAEFAAAGQRAAQQFESVGRISGGVASNMSRSIRRLSVQLGRDITQDLSAVATGFAQAGIAGEDAVNKAAFAIDGVHRSIAETAMGLDMLFEAGAGSSTKMMGQLIKDSNMNLQSSLSLVRDIGLAAGEMGMSFQQASGAITQATSALRMQGTDARELADIMATMQAGFEAQGMSAQRAGAMAARGIGAAAQGIASLEQGMMGLLGQELFPDLSGFEAMVQMRRGMRGRPGEEGNQFFGRTMELLLQKVEAVGATPLEQEGVLTHFLQGNVEGAQAIMAMKEQAEREGVPLAELAAKNSGRLLDTFKNEALKTSTFERMMKRLMDLIAQLGSGLLSLMNTGFEMLVDVGLYSVAKLSAVFTRQDVGDLDTRFGQRMQVLSRQSGTALDHVVGALEGMKDLGIQFGETMLAGGSRKSREEFRTRAVGAISGYAAPTDPDAGSRGLRHARVARMLKELIPGYREMEGGAGRRLFERGKAAAGGFASPQATREALVKMLQAEASLPAGLVKAAESGSGQIVFEVRAKFKRGGAVVEPGI